MAVILVQFASFAMYHFFVARSEIEGIRFATVKDEAFPVYVSDM
jgi:hypothetical protein